MKSVPSEESSIDFRPTNVATKKSTEKKDDELRNAILKIEGKTLPFISAVSPLFCAHLHPREFKVLPKLLKAIVNQLTFFILYKQMNLSL